MFCKHKWKMLSEITTKSKFEHAMTLVPNGAEDVKLPRQLCDATRKHIQTFACEKCGKLKRLVEKI